MSTRSYIGILNPDKTIRAVYCHNNGYPDYMGPILIKYHNSKQAAQKIVALGSLSSLQEKLSPETKTHSFDSPENGVTVAYCRDRGEDLEILRYESIENIVRSAERDGISYIYLYDSNTDKWIYRETHKNDFKRLAVEK